MIKTDTTTNGAAPVQAVKTLAEDGYTVTLEYCGYREMRHVARFRGDWIGQDKTKSGAVMLCVAHADSRE